MAIEKIRDIINQIQEKPNNLVATDQLYAHLYDAEEKKDVQVFSSALLAADKIDTPMTLLMYAAFIGCYKAVTILLEFTFIIKAINIVPVIDNTPFTALDWAFCCEKQNDQIIALLIRSGAHTFADIEKRKISLKPENRPNEEINKFINDNGNTHNPLLEESVRKSIIAFDNLYPIEDINIIEEQILNSYNNVNYKKTINDFMKLANGHGNYKLTDISVLKFVCLVWLGLHDKRLSPEDLSHRINCFYQCMIDLQNSPVFICPEGRCNTLMQLLDKIHPDVTLIYGEGAVKEELLRQFILQFHQRLNKHPEQKKLVLSYEFDEDTPEYQNYVNYFNDVKSIILDNIKNEYTIAFNQGIIEVNNDKDNTIKKVSPATYFKDYFTHTDLPLNVPALKTIRNLQRFHEWIIQLLKTSNGYLNSKQRSLNNDIKNKLLITNNESLQDALNDLTNQAQNLYPHAGWVTLANSRSEIPYWNYLTVLINTLPDNLKSQIANQIILLETGKESDLNDVLDTINQYLSDKITPFPTNIDTQRELLKETLKYCRAVQPFHIFAQDYEQSALRLRMLKAVHGDTWLTSMQRELLMAELMNLAEQAQIDLLLLFRLFYNTMHQPLVTLQQKAYTQLIQLLSAQENPLWTSPLLQTLILTDRNRHRDTFFHLICKERNEQLFDNLRVCFYEQKEAFLDAINTFNISGKNVIQLGCIHQNNEFLIFIHSIASTQYILNSVHTMLKYNAPIAAQFLIDFILDYNIVVINEKWKKHFAEYEKYYYLSPFEKKHSLVLQSLPALSNEQIRIQTNVFWSSYNKIADNNLLINWHACTYLDDAQIMNIWIDALYYDFFETSETLLKRSRQKTRMKLLLATNCYEQTALHRIAASGKFEFIEKILKYFPNHIAIEKYFHLKDECGKTAFTYAMDPRNVIKRNMFIGLLNKYNLINSKLIRYFVLESEFHSVNEIYYYSPNLKNKFELFTQKPRHRLSAWELALKQNKESMISKMLTYGKPEETQKLISRRSRLNYTGIFYIKNAKGIVTESIYYYNSQNNTVLHEICKNNTSFDSGKALLAACKTEKEFNNLLFAKNSLQQTALHVACILESLVMIPGLIESCKKQISNLKLLNAQDSIGCTPLHYAATSGFSFDMIKNLCQQYPDDSSLIDYLCTQAIDGDTALHIAMKTNNRLLLFSGLLSFCPPKARAAFLRITNNKGQTAYDVLLEQISLNKNNRYKLQLLEKDLPEIEKIIIAVNESVVNIEAQITPQSHKTKQKL